MMLQPDSLVKPHAHTIGGLDFPPGLGGMGLKKNFPRTTAGVC